MKYLKFISICLMASFAMSVSATVTAQATLSVQGDEGKKAAEISLVQDNAAAANFADPNNAPYIAGSSVLTPGFYVENGTNKYSDIVLPSLNNVKIKFVANAYETAYTMSFSGVTGEITLANADTSFVIDATKDYKFTCEKSATVEFTVNPAVVYNYTREIATGKWGTICYPEAIAEVVGATIYEFIEKTATQVVADPVSLPLVKGKAYLFLATADAQGFNYSDATQATAPEANNGLVGTFVDITSTAEAPYVIKGNSLMPAKPAKVAANRAYVPVLGDIQNTGAPARAGRMYFNVVNTPTGMELIEAPAMKEGKMILNGRMVIVKDGKMFNAQGAAL